MTDVFKLYKVLFQPKNFSQIRYRFLYDLIYLSLYYYIRTFQGFSERVGYEGFFTCQMHESMSDL